MPKPYKGEKKSEYISRAIKQLVEKEGRHVDQAAAIAYSMWKNKRKK